ncbi:MAG: hypothetical protein LC791_12395 [Acidobacteria bacterium]|nr:hypothetical protein [Acidobacteriota bacterium]
MNALGLPVRLVDGVARLLVFALVASSGGPWLHGEDCHDTGCDSALVIHDASQHRIGADTGRSAHDQADHCATCHAARAFRSAPRQAAASPLLSAGARFPHPQTTSPHLQLDLRVAARAPPFFA